MGGDGNERGHRRQFRGPRLPRRHHIWQIYVSLDIDCRADGIVDGHIVSPSSGTISGAVPSLPLGWPDPGYSGIFSLLVGWQRRQTTAEQWIEPVIQVVKDAEAL